MTNPPENGLIEESLDLSERFFFFCLSVSPLCFATSSHFEPLSIASLTDVVGRM